MVLLGIFLSTSALIIGNMLQHYITDPMESLEMRTWMWDHYGTAYNAAYTFFEVTFAGSFGRKDGQLVVAVSGESVSFGDFGVTRNRTKQGTGLPMSDRCWTMSASCTCYFSVHTLLWSCLLSSVSSQRYF